MREYATAEKSSYDTTDIRSTPFRLGSHHKLRIHNIPIVPFRPPQSPTDRILPHPPSSPHHPHHQTLYILDCSFNPAHNPHTSTLPTSALKFAHLFHLVQPLSLFKDAECRRDWGGDTRDYQWTRQRNICTILSPKKSLPRPQHLPYFCCCSPPPHNNKPSQRNSISNF